MKRNRRDLFIDIGKVGGGMFLAGGLSKSGSFAAASSPSEEPEDGEITAVEDLMREHGVLRRILFLYSEAAMRLHSNPANVGPDAIHKAAELFRSFGEDYHEKKLEEAYIFPVVRKSGGPASNYPDILTAQHNRGRQITGYVLEETQATKLDADNAEPLAVAMNNLVRMYRAHAAREDTIVFPAWKLSLTSEQLDHMNEKFEDIEHEMFGEDGFEKAVWQIGDIEKEFGLADLSQFTAPPPPQI
jgi:hemerythrin-like domain-containing protein